MDNFETILKRVVQALSPDANLTSSELSDLIAEAGRRVADIQAYIDSERAFIADPASDLIMSSNSAMELVEPEVEIGKLRNAIPRLIDLRDARQDAEDHAARLAAREKAATEYETCLRKFLAYAPTLAKIAAAHSAFQAASRAAIETHRALPDAEPLIEIGVDHCGVSDNLAETLEKASRQMTEAADKRPERDAASREYRLDAPERFKREQRMREAEKAAFDAGDHAKFHMGLGHVGSSAAMAAARQTVLDGGTFEQAAAAGVEAARSAVEKTKQSQAA